MKTATFTAMTLGLLIAAQANATDAGDSRSAAEDAAFQARMRREIRQLEQATCCLLERIGLLESLLDKSPLSDAPPDDSTDGNTANPPRGLEGYCPVELVTHEKWVRGDPQYTASYQGRTYWLSSPEAYRDFCAAPQRYAPVLSGNDPVVLRDYGKLVAGGRRHGVFYESEIYLFASEGTLGRFNSDPERYAQFVRTQPAPAEKASEPIAAPSVPEPQTVRPRIWTLRRRLYR